MARFVRNTFSLLLSCLMLFTIIFFSCEKADTSDFVNLAEVAEVHVNADINSTYLFSVFQKMLFDTALINRDTAMIDSAVVYRSADIISGITSYIIDYGEGVSGSDYKLKSGKIEAILDKNFSEENATLQAAFDNYAVDGMLYTGSATYINTGQFLASEQKLLFDVDFLVFDDQQQILNFQSSKEIFWTNGFATPEKPLEQRFTINGNGTSNYTNNLNTSIPKASITSEISREWEISFSCTKLIRQGAINIVETIENVEEIITGDMIDSDVDGCSDKIMLKNSDNFGYPIYL